MWGCETSPLVHHYQSHVAYNNIKTGFISMLSNHGTLEASRQTGRKLLV